MQVIRNKSYDAERALYGSHDLLVKDCAFDGPADGESAFKECRNVEADRCFFNLRYPFWHDHGLTSIKNPLTGSRISLPAVGEVIRDINGADGAVELRPAAACA